MTGAAASSKTARRAASLGLFRNRAQGRALTVATVVRILGGLLFVLSAVPKITAHQNEIDMFGQFGLPRSSVLVYVVAALEIACGLLLLVGLLTRLAAAAMAANMVGAILTAARTSAVPSTWAWHLRSSWQCFTYCGRAPANSPSINGEATEHGSRVLPRRQSVRELGKWKRRKCPDRHYW